MLRLIPALLLLLLSSQSSAATGNIASLCKQQWPAAKASQTFCIKEKRNYQNWLRYTRKRAHADPAISSRIDSCVKDNKPDYREAYDCVFDRGLFHILPF